jgi:hypothetical protein
MGVFEERANQIVRAEDLIRGGLSSRKGLATDLGVSYDIARKIYKIATYKIHQDKTRKGMDAVFVPGLIRGVGITREDRTLISARTTYRCRIPPIFAYICVVDNGGALKFGVSGEIEKRANQHIKSTKDYVFGVWEFNSEGSCRSAELECKHTLSCGVVSRFSMPDGHTETVSLLDLEKIIAIYERFGGVRVLTPSKD